MKKSMQSKKKNTLSPLQFYQLTDLHYYATEEIGSYGRIFDFKCSMDQKCMAESGAIIDATFDRLIADESNKVIVITGDLTFDGEVQSHNALIPKLQKLKRAGKQVYVTFATHDFNMEARGYNDNGVFELQKLNREQLRAHYADFGWNEAISEHVPSYSYAVKPADGYRFLMLNDDGDGLEFCGFYDDLLEWIKAQCEEAKQQGERIIAFTHHPVLPPNDIYPLFSHRDMLGGYETTAPFLADCGIEFIFTGHTHMQSIRKLITESGNKLYHINTGSLIAYPVPYRNVVIGEDGVDVSTKNVESFNWPLKGMTVEEYTEAHFEFMLKDIFYSAEYDIEEFKLLAKGFSLSAETIDKLKPLFVFMGKVINRLTFKSLAKLLHCTKAVDSSIADIKIRDFMLNVINAMFSGIKLYGPETYEYIAFMAFVKKLKPFVKLKDNDGNAVDLESVISDLLYNTDELDNTNQFLPY